MPADLANRLTELDRSLDELGQNDSAPAGTGDVYNALLAEAGSQKPDDPVLGALEPVSKSFEGSEFADITVGALRALVQQLLAAVEE